MLSVFFRKHVIHIFIPVLSPLLTLFGLGFSEGRSAWGREGGGGSASGL